MVLRQAIIDDVEDTLFEVPFLMPQRLPLLRSRFAVLWPAAGLMDTEIRCFIELEDYNGAKEAQPRVQA